MHNHSGRSEISTSPIDFLNGEWYTKSHLITRCAMTGKRSCLPVRGSSPQRSVSFEVPVACKVQPTGKQDLNDSGRKADPELLIVLEERCVPPSLTL